jgi:restriction system protein
MNESPKQRLRVMVVSVRRRAMSANDTFMRFARRHLTQENLQVVTRAVVQNRELALLMSAGAFAVVQSIWPGSADVATPCITASLVAIPLSIYFRVDASIKAKITSIVMPYQRELSVKRQQLYRTGSFGLVEDKPWRKEVERFLDRIVAPQVSLKSDSRRQWARDLVDHVARTAPVVEGFFAGMTPVEYEHLVARTLRNYGWHAGTTKGSGDQGVDVLASKAPFRLVIQCKLYTNSVGNAAVQEAISAREWEGATHGAVVSNAKYTKAAKELAHKSGIMLWHHDDLPVADRECAGMPTHVARRPGATMGA